MLKTGKLRNINMGSIYGWNGKTFKIPFIINYFIEFFRSDQEGSITFSRFTLSDIPDWNSKEKFCDLTVVDDGYVKYTFHTLYLKH